MRKLFVRNYNTYIPPVPVPKNYREWNWNTASYSYTMYGRKVARQTNSSGMEIGTVMSYVDKGVEKAILIWDCLWRNKYPRYCIDNTNLNDLLPADKKLVICTQTGQALPNTGALPYPGCGDFELTDLPPYSTISNQDSHDSKYNTDNLASLGSVAEKFDDLRHGGDYFDVPSINELIRIYAEMETLDNMDTHKTDLPEFTLQNVFSNSAFMSSTYSDTDSDGDHCCLILNGNGEIEKHKQFNTYYGNSTTPIYCLSITYITDIIFFD